jgi:hypothetical protein
LNEESQAQSEEMRTLNNELHVQKEQEHTAPDKGER